MTPNFYCVFEQYYVVVLNNNIITILYKGIPWTTEIVFSIENNYPVQIFLCENLHIWMSAFEWNTKNFFYFKILEVMRHFMTNI